MTLLKKKRKRYNRNPVIKITSDGINILGLITDVAILFSIWITHYLYVGGIK